MKGVLVEVEGSSACSFYTANFDFFPLCKIAKADVALRTRGQIGAYVMCPLQPGLQ